VKTRPVRLAPCAAGARPRIEDAPPAGSPKAGDRPPPVRLARRNAARFLAGDELAPRHEPRAAPAVDDLALELAEPAHSGGWASSPRMSRCTSGSRSSRRAGWPVRSWRDTSSNVAPTIAKASSAERETPGRRRRSPVHRLLVHPPARRRFRRAVAQLGDARAGAHRLDEDRLGHRRVSRRRSRGSRAAPRGWRFAIVRGPRGGADLDEHVEHDQPTRTRKSANEALLLVGEVLVERRLRHPGPGG